MLLIFCRIYLQYRLAKGKSSKKSKPRTISQAEQLSRKRHQLQQSETLRWERAVDDPEAEMARIEEYKRARRERYAAQQRAVLDKLKPR